MNPTKPKAIALHFDGESAPTVSARGQGRTAERIIKIAEEHQVPIQQDKHLLNCLAKVKLNQRIPEKLFVAVAQLLAYLYYLEGKTPADIKK